MSYLESLDKLDRTLLTPTLLQPGPVIHECSVCHKIFSNAKNLKRHQAVCLSTNLDDTKNEASDFELPTESTQRQQTVPCPLCNSIQVSTFARDRTLF